MTLEDRARRASLGIRQAVGTVGVLPNERLERFHRYRARTERNRRVGAAVLAAILTLGAVALVKGAFDTSASTPATPVAPTGTILYARWMSNAQQGRWFTVSPDGSQVTDLHVTATCAEWWPGGGKIFITNDAAVEPGQPLRPATVAPDGSGLHALDAAADPDLNLGCGDVSPDGSRLAVEGFSNGNNRARHGIYTVRASDGGDLVRLTTGADSYPRYSPDGSRIVFLRTKPGVVPDGAGALFVINADGSLPHRVTPWGGAFLNFSWSPDGNWIAFEQPYGRLALVHADGTGLHVIPIALPAGSGATNPSWSPDGDWLVFSLADAGSAGIDIVRPDGSDLTVVTRGSGLPDLAPDWGP
ncbi:MAG: TolB family protein [Actinomycetota bacterium]